MNIVQQQVVDFSSPLQISLTNTYVIERVLRLAVDTQGYEANCS